MNLLPSQDDVLGILRETGAMRDGHFEYPNGLHSNEYLQVPLAMRSYEHAKVLSVGLSRLLRSNSEIRAMIPQLSIVAPATAGLPVAYGICEALRAKQVYWAEQETPDQPGQRFRKYMEPRAGEHVIIVDDILRSGNKLSAINALLESYNAVVIGIAVLVYQPLPTAKTFGKTPLYYLSQLRPTYYMDAAACDLCKQGVPVEKVFG